MRILKEFDLAIADLPNITLVDVQAAIEASPTIASMKSKDLQLQEQILYNLLFHKQHGSLDLVLTRHLKLHLKFDHRFYLDDLLLLILK